MNYQQTIDFLFSQLPIYQRQGKIAYRADLGKGWPVHLPSFTGLQRAR